MPTVTRISTARITNFGPLTTTYTAPASCATETDRIYFAYDSDHPEYLWANPTCKMQLIGKCIPSGDQYDHLITATYAKTFDLGFYHYYSPGLYCPSDWTTAGKYVRGTGSIGQMSGQLTRTESTMVPERWEPGRPFRQDPASVWVQVLEPSETLAELHTQLQWQLLLSAWSIVYVWILGDMRVPIRVNRGTRDTHEKRT
ncbi:uncharacterized protein FSUBG_12305 [Fusarium subglutinans]|uniref:Uncharacterized protein n=1 Tax=Gibberella subglutinans TaxID=42677 RepID=A0A8H5P020_GIBSU|nr:uncharacterized protein FSUBG_12305 [Fusarium subglutinans]KAF5585846.1 hypothetical protein FSUBG_12305 [Fusarium subglutinans]